ncbi:MAG: hypothetical protein H9806_08340 [Candidatus Lactobacillus pullistercoris]|uniref:Uncharacterized protein n=1 Tax=Candidatus Lactobacillus pullistercoris TaxID=2838636 RepID=A0A9E2KS00_9LACO|nr:hypothetical protein [Candidatus Lactobacillus pullistercoris]
MKNFIKYLVAILFVIGGIFMIGWILGDNETGTPAGLTALYMIVEGIFFYHYFRNRSIGIL